MKEKKFENATAFVVQFDSPGDFLKKHKVRFQSTIIAFKGAEEKGRSTGDVDLASIRGLMERAL